MTRAVLTWGARLTVLASVPLAALWATPRGDAGDAAPDPAPSSLPSPQAIDAALERAQRAQGVSAAKPVDDARFLRRLSLDTRGTIPTPGELARFQADSKPRKRARWIDRFLDSSAFARHQARDLRSRLLQRDGASEELDVYRDAFELWLEGELERDRGYDEIVAEIVAAEGRSDQNPAILYTLVHAGFDGAGADELAGTVTRQFLDLSLACARCHDHPFNDYTQTDYHRQAAFFARVRIGEGEPGVDETFRVRETPLGEHRAALLKGSQRVFAPGYLQAAGTPARDRSGLSAGAAPTRYTRTSRRAAFAGWLTSRDNPWFARATVNLVWRRLFGRGLVESMDDPDTTADPSHRKLLNQLARGFASSGFSLRTLYAAILQTRAYQRGLRPRGGELGEARKLFAAAVPRPLPARVLLDSLLRAGGRDRPAPGELPSTRRVVRARLLASLERAMPRRQREPDVESVTPLGALAILNGRAAVGLSRGPALDLILRTYDQPAERVRALYLRTVSRAPTSAERRAALAYLTEQRHTREAHADVFWALLATSEFATNH